MKATTGIETSKGKGDGTSYPSSINTNGKPKSANNTVVPQKHRDTQAIIVGYNYGGYRNLKVDRLIDHANQQSDLNALKRDLWRIQQILHDEQPYTFDKHPHPPSAAGPGA